MNGNALSQSQPPQQHDRLILIRHGRPALSRRCWLDWRGYQDWWRQYDEGGLKQPQEAPQEIADYARSADLVMSSTLRRAVESASLAAGRAPDLMDADLVEAPLPPPHLGPVRLTPRAWGVIARIIWYLGYSDGMESHRQARARARRMAGKLDDYASDGKTVFVAGHGWYNRMLKAALKQRGWRCTSQNGDSYWSRRVFERR